MTLAEDYVGDEYNFQRVELSRKHVLKHYHIVPNILADLRNLETDIFVLPFDKLNWSSQCSRPPSVYVNRRQIHQQHSAFSLDSWLIRGICIRAKKDLAAAIWPFVVALRELDRLREGESAGECAGPLPTIGARPRF